MRKLPERNRYAQAVPCDSLKRGAGDKRQKSEIRGQRTTATFLNVAPLPLVVVCFLIHGLTAMAIKNGPRGPFPFL
jgi:hypothetical protein